MERALLGLVGARIGRSISPAMHEAAGRATGIDVRYHLIDAHVIGFGPDALPQLLNGVKLAGFAGVNVTFPFKEAIVPWLDGIEGAAQQVGAANTVVVRDGRLVGHNTDYSGFISGWRRAFESRKPGVAALIGAGGVGRAIAHALAALGAEEVRLSDLEPARAATLAQILRSRYPGVRAIVAADAQEACAGASGIVNATPVGMHAFPGSPVPEWSLSGIAWTMDAVYTPLETAFISAARRAGAAVMTGQELAIGQAMDAFELFFGRPAPEEVMRDTFLAAVAGTVPLARNDP
jgi:quinate/shikimate dehydrogenase (NAD+)